MRLLRSGFTLAEILIALVILALGLTMLFNIYPLAWHSFAYSSKLNEATALAQKKFEELKSEAVLTAGTRSGSDKSMNWQLMLTDLPSDVSPQCMKAQLCIDFSIKAASHKECFVTYLSHD
jgi:prepilin-type N-terminal cleavage/methylation domain-containing protein